MKSRPSYNRTHPIKRLDHLTEAAADMLDFLDDYELANLSGLSVDQVEKMRNENIKPQTKK